MDDKSNVDEVIVRLAWLVKSFNWLRPGIDQSLGRDICNKVAEGIVSRATRFKKGANEVWQDNCENEPPRGGYRGWKERKYGVTDQPNVRTGQMLSEQSMVGKRTKITEDLITMYYGNNDAPKTSYGGTSYISKQDKQTTDTEKAKWAHQGQSKYRIKRPFYEMDDEIAAAVVKATQEALNEMIAEINAGTGP